jgi:hypothetical protein
MDGDHLQQVETHHIRPIVRIFYLANNKSIGSCIISARLADHAASLECSQRLINLAGI